jgi:tartrate dehydrogenase/decarboxylase/D-malate dehydrogenase
MVTPTEDDQQAPHRRHPGDGIGNEVVPEGIRVLEAVGRPLRPRLRLGPPGLVVPALRQDRRHDAGRWAEQIAKHDAIYLGAVGWPGVPDHVSLWGLLIPIRRGFQQYVNLRPVRLFEGLKSPLADRKPGDIDYFIVRENNEGEYSSVGGRSFEGTELEQAVRSPCSPRRAASG